LKYGPRCVKKLQFISLLKQLLSLLPDYFIRGELLNIRGAIMSTSEICPAQPGLIPQQDYESSKRSQNSPLSPVQSEYLIKNNKGIAKILGHSTELLDAIPDLVDLGKASKQDFAGKDPTGRETMRTIAGATAKGLTVSAIAGATVAAIGGACAVLIAPAAALAVPIIAGAGAAAIYFAPSYAEAGARKAVDFIGDSAQAAGKWLKSWI
jgi:hypothetical protein